MILCLYIIIKFQMEPKKDQIMCHNVWTLTFDICGKTPKTSNKMKIKTNTGLHYSVGSYVKLSGIHGGWCWFDMNISIGTHQIFINLVSV